MLSASWCSLAIGRGGLPVPVSDGFQYVDGNARHGHILRKDYHTSHTRSEPWSPHRRDCHTEAERKWNSHAHKKHQKHFELLSEPFKPQKPAQTRGRRYCTYCLLDYLALRLAILSKPLAWGECVCMLLIDDTQSGKGQPKLYRKGQNKGWHKHNHIQIKVSHTHSHTETARAMFAHVHRQ